MNTAKPTRLPLPTLLLLTLPLLVLTSLLGAIPAAAQDAAELWVEGKTAMAAGKWEEAHEIFRLFADNYSDSPRLPEVWLELARTEPDGDQSRRWLERIVDDHPQSDAAGHAQLLLGEADLLTGSPEKTVARLRTIEREGYPLSIWRRALLVRAEAKRITDDLDGATLDFSDVLDAEPDGFEAKRITDDLDGATLDFSDVLDSEPDDFEAARALLGLASVAALRGDLRQAELYVSESFSRFPRGDLAATSLWRWARALMEQGLTGRAEDVLERLGKRYPETPESAAAREVLDRLSVAEPSLSDPPAPREAPATHPAGEITLVYGAQGDTGVISPDDTSAVMLLELEEEEYVVRLGSFSFWEDADELRRELAVESEFGLRVVPERRGEPPYRLESLGIPNRRRAFDFARWLESVGGYLTQVIETTAERH